MRSALAAVVAIALIAGALYLRTTFIDGDGDPVVDGTTVPDAGDEGQALSVACDRALEAVCPPGGQVLDIGALLDAFRSTPAEYDVLLAPSATLELIQQSQTSRVTFDDAPFLLATTPLVVAIATSRDELVADACGAAVTWPCVADLITARQLAPAVMDPQNSTVGLTALAALTGGFFGTASYTTNALGGTDFLGWLDAVGDEVAVSFDPLNDLYAFRGARNDAAVSAEASALAVMGSAAASIAELYWPTPTAYLTAVAAPVQGVERDAVEGIAQAAAQSLLERGWRGPDGTPVPTSTAAVGAPALDPQQDGLPSGGVLFTLRDRSG